MIKREAVRLAAQMAGLKPEIVKSAGPKWDAFLVEYSEVVQRPDGGLEEIRRIAR